jgi:hypothetical protein
MGMSFAFAMVYLKTKGFKRQIPGRRPGGVGGGPERETARELVKKGLSETT